MIKRTYQLVITTIIANILCACLDPPTALTEDPEAFPQRSRIAELLSDRGVAGYPMATEARTFSFPEDHGAHETFRNEWWYFTGNVADEAGHWFGYQLTLFRFALQPHAAPPLASSWQTRHAFIGHFAVSDLSRERFHVAERYARGAAGLAGVRQAPLAVWIDDWLIESAGTDGSWRLRANDDEIAIELSLEAVKPVVLNGVDGLSQKSAEPGNASYYYSLSRLGTTGRLTVDGQSYRVSGLSWLDREWGSSALAADQAGWDWFALQLSDGSDLMLYNVRRSDGSADPFSAGTAVAADGSARHLHADEFTIDVQDHWVSSGGVRYPAKWQLSVPALDLEITVRPAMADQELVTSVRYWEGAVIVDGLSGELAVTGRGYVELTGYDFAADQ